MAENRDEILANFQACTGIDDVGESIMHLEQTNWDLLKAINQVIPQDGGNTNADTSMDIELIKEIKGTEQNLNDTNNKSMEDDDVIICNDSKINFPYVNTNASVTGPSTSDSKDKTRMLKFIITFKDQTFTVNLQECQSVSDLKRQIQKTTNVPLCRQYLVGWRRHPKSDSCTLISLNLPLETRLTLNTVEADQDGHMETDDEIIERLNLTYTLHIKDETRSNVHSLNFIGTTSILDVKSAVYSITNIPVRHQVWSGWPENLKEDSTLLGYAGIDHPVHYLYLRSSESEEKKKQHKRIIHLDDSDDSSVEEFEDATESFTADDDFISDMRSRRLQPLIPDMVEDETAGCLHFSDEFTSRYGALHPEFFPGTLDDAIKEACMKSARERRLLALYLHHDGSVLSNVFCTQLLCCESVLQCLAANFVVWGWDLTFEWNNLKFLASLTNCLGGVAAFQIKNIPQERLPAIVIISRTRSVTEITAVIQGNVGVNELMASLTEAVDVFTMQQKIEIKEEDERTAREMIKFEQDAAYRESLERDRAKEEARKQQEMMETQEKEKAEKQKKLEEAKKEAERLEVESRLPSEPSEVGGDNVTKIRFRLPKGEFIERRFYVSEALQVLLDYLVVQGYPQSEYKVISSWPRRDLTSVDPNQTFLELKLCPQETVILEER
ncbi:hypothetical protein RUM44_011638 [Polyplax serrata]|uniref:UBX domain-containing protein n=1 Tax=Polyplax serrata TaxID=468196 RepID=A0ABR1ASD2_POLSC